MSLHKRIRQDFLAKLESISPLHEKVLKYIETNDLLAATTAWKEARDIHTECREIIARNGNIKTQYSPRVSQEGVILIKLARRLSAKTKQKLTL